MIIDAHAHFEPRLLPVEGLLAQMRETGTAQTILIPALTDPPETQKAAVLMAVQRWMFSLDWLRPVGIAITKSMYKSDGEWHLWYRKPSAGAHKFKIVLNPDNEAVVRLLKSHPERFLGWTFINPLQPDALEQFEKYRAVPGMVGLKVHPFWHRFPMPAVHDLARRCEASGWPLLVHLGFDESGDYQWLVERFPRLKIIFAHLGVPYYRKIWEVVRKHERIFMDISSTYHVDRRLLKNAVRQVGPEKIIFGTDNPYSDPQSMSIIKGWVDSLGLSAQDKDKIFSKNILQLIGR